MPLALWFGKQVVVFDDQDLHLISFPKVLPQSLVVCFTPIVPFCGRDKYQFTLLVFLLIVSLCVFSHLSRVMRQRTRLKSQWTEELLSKMVSRGNHLSSSSIAIITIIVTFIKQHIIHDQCHYHCLDCCDANIAWQHYLPTGQQITLQLICSVRNFSAKVICISLNYVASYCILLCYIALYCIILYFIAFYFILLHSRHLTKMAKECKTAEGWNTMKYSLTGFAIKAYQRRFRPFYFAEVKKCTWKNCKIMQKCSWNTGSSRPPLGACSAICWQNMEKWRAR